MEFGVLFFMECQCPDQKVGGGALLLGFVLVV
jgi:hypothetical protein